MKLKRSMINILFSLKGIVVKVDRSKSNEEKDQEVNLIIFIQI